MLSTLCILPRGVAAAEPVQQELSSDEINQLVLKQAGMQLQDVHTGEETDAAAEAAAANAEEEEGSDADMRGEDGAEAKMSGSNDDDADAASAEIDDKEAALLKELKMGKLLYDWGECGLLYAGILAK